MPHVTAPSAGHRPWLAATLAALALVLAAAFEGPSLLRVPGQLLATCAFWAAAAILSEALSISGFVVAFDLVFGARLTWRQSAIGGLRGLGATAALPAGGLVGPVAAASSIGTQRPPQELARATVALTILTNAPGVIALIVLSVALALGVSRGPHDALRTVLPASVGVVLVGLTVLATRCRADDRPGRIRATGRALRGGAVDAGAHIRSGDWRLLGGLTNAACDSAVLAIAFLAIGHPQSLVTVMMGYLVGSLGSVVPVPAGIGAVEGGLIGALVLYGAPAAPTAAAVVLYRAVTLPLQTILGAAAWGSLPLSRLRRSTSRVDHHQQGVHAC